MDQGNTILIISPVFNDWDCLEMLYRELKEEFRVMERNFTLLAVNDGSTQPFPAHLQLQKEGNDIPLPLPENEILVLDLQRNMGHQKAITTGLAYATRFFNPAYIIVMDSDGEDRPRDVALLINAVKPGEEKIIFAHRKSRRESPMFKFLYRWYKVVFKFLTGYIITFGNFVLIPRALASRLVYISEIWNHFPGGIIRSKLPYRSVPIDRGVRYNGRSKMSMVALIQHGISSITVNIDLVSVRLLIFSFLLIGVTSALLCIIIFIKIFTDYAIPGWTSNVAIGLTMIMLQAFFFSLLLTFMVLNARIQPQFIPAKDFTVYVRALYKCYLND